MTLFQRLRTGALLLGLGLTPIAAGAGPFAQPEGEVLLTIEGTLALDAPAEGYKLDLAGLKALPQTTFTTTTIWTDGDKVFTGISMKRLLELSGAKGDTIWAEALNGYVVEMKTSDLDGDFPIIAYEIDGKTFPRRDKGPLWIVYPYDSDAKYKTEITYANSVWQLQKLRID